MEQPITRTFFGASAGKASAGVSLTYCICLLTCSSHPRGCAVEHRNALTFGFMIMLKTSYIRMYLCAFAGFIVTFNAGSVNEWRD